MHAVLTTFRDRAGEVNTYFKFLASSLASSKNDDLNKILKSNLLLMLYNLIESSMTNAIEEIHNDIHINTVSFNLLRVNIRRLLISYLKTHLNAKDFVTSITDIALDTAKRCFDKQKIFSGNVDGKKIREIGEEYGFSIRTTYANTKNGNCLVIIKGRRNDLAHGVFSFIEVGKEYTISDLEAMKDETVNYIEEILNNISTYLTNREYLEPPVGSSASVPVGSPASASIGSPTSTPEESPASVAPSLPIKDISTDPDLLAKSE